MTDAEFRAYLYMMATRGTAFWEMLYSYNLMDEGNKWMINAEALNFIEKTTKPYATRSTLASHLLQVKFMVTHVGKKQVKQSS